VLGPEIEELRSGDPVADARERQAFAEAAVESAKIDESGGDRAVLVIGADDWPFPIHLVKDAAVGASIQRPVQTSS
jgi:predicted TIM-barrel enzyme